jgi:hypothetical protein
MRARALIVVGSVLLAACVSPARTTRDYEAKAADTAETVLASVRTAALVVRVAREGNAFGPYVSVTLSDSEGDAASASATFLTIQPPDSASDALRARLSAILDDAGNALSLARIAARRNRLDELAALAPTLSQLGTTLERMVERYG